MEKLQIDQALTTMQNLVKQNEVKDAVILKQNEALTTLDDAHRIELTLQIEGMIKHLPKPLAHQMVDRIYK